jgi:hypothetical protein
MKARPFKRVFVGSDLHCGHYVGLTHPDYYEPSDTKWGQTQRSCWEFFSEKADKYKPFDIVILNGDLIAGKNQKSGGRQVVTHNMKDQCKMALKVIKYLDCPVIRIQRGTPYHVAPNGDNWEDVLIEMFPKEYDVKIHDQGFYKINGKHFNCKHKIGSSTIPHGRLTALAKEILWANIWHNKGVQQRPDVLIRSHVHYYEHIEHEGCHGIITPALQGLGDEYGQQQCSGTVDFGFVVIDVYDNGRIDIMPEIMKGFMQCSQSEVL